jgi:hypothetical protein
MAPRETRGFTSIHPCASVGCEVCMNSLQSTATNPTMLESSGATVDCISAFQRLRLCYDYSTPSTITTTQKPIASPSKPQEKNIHSSVNKDYRKENKNASLLLQVFPHTLFRAESGTGQRFVGKGLKVKGRGGAIVALPRPIAKTRLVVGWGGGLKKKTAN